MKDFNENPTDVKKSKIFNELKDILDGDEVKEIQDLIFKSNDKVLKSIELKELIDETVLSLSLLTIMSLSFIHGWQLRVSKVFIKLIGFPCHKILCSGRFLMSKGLDFLCKGKCFAKCLA